jgi:hypothetical protein
MALLQKGLILAAIKKPPDWADGFRERCALVILSIRQRHEIPKIKLDGENELAHFVHEFGKLVSDYTPGILALATVKIAAHTPQCNWTVLTPTPIMSPLYNSKIV